MSFRLFLASSVNTPRQSIPKETAWLNDTTAPLRSSSANSWMAGNKPGLMFGRKSNGTGLVDTTHLSDDSWVRQLQETQRELAEEAHGVDNIQKKKMEKRHGKPEDEFKVGDLVLIHSKATSVDRELTDDEYEVEKVLDHHYTSQGLEYRLKWKGFSNHHNSWEPEHNIINTPDLVQAYWRASITDDFGLGGGSVIPLSHNTYPYLSMLFPYQPYHSFNYCQCCYHLYIIAFNS
ncbi:Chromobox protein 1 [Balamuthia mandrillaris]